MAVDSLSHYFRLFFIGLLPPPQQNKYKASPRLSCAFEMLFTDKMWLDIYCSLHTLSPFPFLSLYYAPRDLLQPPLPFDAESSPVDMMNYAGSWRRRPRPRQTYYNAAPRQHILRFRPSCKLLHSPASIKRISSRSISTGASTSLDTRRFGLREIGRPCLLVSEPTCTTHARMP